MELRLARGRLAVELQQRKAWVTLKASNRQTQKGGGVRITAFARLCSLPPPPFSMSLNSFTLPSLFEAVVAGSEGAFRYR